MTKSRIEAVDREQPVEDESQDHKKAAFAPTNGQDIDTHNKAGLKRAPLAVGLTKPAEDCRWIKEMYCVEISGTHFSIAKSQQAKRSGEVSAARSAT